MIDYQASKADPLSDVVALLRPKAVAWRVFEAHDQWSVRFPATGLVVFGQMIEGQCRIARADRAPVDFATGDFLLMAAPSSWVAHTAAGLAPVAFEEVIGKPGCLLSPAPDPTITRFIAGAFVFAAPNAKLLTDMFPPFIHLRSAGTVATRLATVLAHLGDEALASRPGRSLVLDRLLEIILVEVLRSPSGGFAASRGLLAGLADRQIGSALTLMHDDARRPWTVSELARHVGMSRSSFAAHFAAKVGLPPIDYLLQWRITLAKAALKAARQPMSDIARGAGYRSVSAFSTAFSRAVGCSPTAYLKSAAASPAFDELTFSGTARDAGIVAASR